MALKIYLMRHGETNHNIKSSDDDDQPKEEPLNQTGILQAERLANRIKNIKFDKLFSSDFTRAKQTAEIISSRTGLPIIEDKRLREYQHGRVKPSSEKWIEEYRRLLNSGMSKYEIRPFGGENIWDLIKRLKSFLKELEKDNGVIAIVAHAGANSVLINLSQRREKDEFIDIKQDNSCINILEFSEEKWKIICINDSSHSDELKPKKRLYENQEEIKEIAKKYVLEKLGLVAKEIYLYGDILQDRFGFYDRPYKKYDGSTVETYIVPKDDLDISQWKISLIKNNVKKYEIGEIKINNKKHKVNVILVDNSNEIKTETERIK